MQEVTAGNWIRGQNSAVVAGREGVCPPAPLGLWAAGHRMGANLPPEEPSADKAETCKPRLGEALARRQLGT